MIPELSPYAEYDPDWTNVVVGDTNAHASFAHVATNLQNNLYNLRLTFRWPLLPNGDSGPGRQVFRTMASGFLTNDPIGDPSFFTNLYFLQPRTYVKTQ
jgi:hypothetical protein